MAYSTTYPPVMLANPVGGSGTLVAAGSLGKGGTLWFYASADVDSDVIAAAYITDALNLGMKVGDAVFIWDSTTPKGSLAFVTAVASTGSTMAFAAVA